MKNLKYIYLAILTSISFIACEDDEALSARDGDPLLEENIINVNATLATDQLIVGEGNLFDFTVTLDKSFNSDATVTVKMEFDNGGITQGTAVVAAGETTGSGTFEMPSDDGLITGSTITGADNAGELTAIGFLLEELVPNTTYTISSNKVDVGIYPDTLPIGGGINVLADWNGAPEVDIDMEIWDRAFINQYEGSGSGSRFESDLFQNLNRPDGIYDVYLVAFTPIPTGGVDYSVLLTLPTNVLVDIIGTLPDTTPVGTPVAVATFEKITDVESGIVSYINVTGL